MGLYNSFLEGLEESQGHCVRCIILKTNYVNNKIFKFQQQPSVLGRKLHSVASDTFWIAMKILFDSDVLFLKR